MTLCPHKAQSLRGFKPARLLTPAQIAARVIPALLMLCCGLEGPSKGLEAAVAAATAAAAKGPQRPEATTSSSSNSSVAQTAAVDGHDLSAGSGSGAHGATAAAADSRTYVRRSSVSTGGAVGDGGHVEVLDSIAEPAYAVEGEEDESASGASDSRVNTAGSGASKGAGIGNGGKNKGGKKKSKKPAKLEPAMVEAQTQASAAVKLLALSSDTARSALLSAGALSVLLPLLDGSVSQARWNARQVSLGRVPLGRLYCACCPSLAHVCNCQSHRTSCLFTGMCCIVESKEWPVSCVCCRLCCLYP